MMSANSPDLQKVTTFFNQFKNYSRDRLDFSIKNFCTAFGFIGAGMDSIHDLVSERERYRATDFNIFAILGLQCQEVRTHSAFLANLLDPKGSHGQKELFLKSFLDMCNKKSECKLQYSENNWNDWVVRTEHAFYNGRIDIVLWNRTDKILITIENKIYAMDQQDQLERYHEWMKNQKKLYAQQLLIYLTIDGKESEGADPNNYKCASYQKDIKPILEESISHIMAPKVRECVRQYCEVITKLWGNCHAKTL